MRVTNIRKFKQDDINQIIEILKKNGQCKHPEVDGPEAMIRVANNHNAVFLVAEVNSRIVGVVRGVYDGSRAIVHQISVHPDWQEQGIGKQLIKNIAKQFIDLGAPTLAVTAGEQEEGLNSIKYFQKLGFQNLPVKLMVHFNIKEIIGDK